MSEIKEMNPIRIQAIQQHQGLMTALKQLRERTSTQMMTLYQHQVTSLETVIENQSAELALLHEFEEAVRAKPTDIALINSVLSDIDNFRKEITKAAEDAKKVAKK